MVYLYRTSRRVIRWFEGLSGATAPTPRQSNSIVNVNEENEWCSPSVAEACSWQFR